MLAAMLLTSTAYPVFANEDKMHGKEHGYGGGHDEMDEHGKWDDDHRGVYIEVEVYSNWSKVEIKIDGTESKLILHTVNIDKIIDAIVNETGLSRDVVENSIRIEIKERSHNFWKYFRGKEMVEEKRIKYREMMEKREEMKENYLRKYSETRQLYQKVKHRGFGDPVVFNATKDFVIYGIDFIITHLDSLELRIMTMNINNTTAQNLSGDISSIRSELEYWKEKINISTTPEELRNNVRAFSSEWKTLRVKISAVTGKVLSLKLLDIIENAEKNSAKIEDKILELENRSIDTSDIWRVYNRYLERLASAKEHALKSVDHFNNALDSGDTGTARWEFSAGKSEYSKAISDMKESLNDLKRVFKEFRDALRAAGSGGE